MVEPRIVAPVVVGSIPIIHPINLDIILKKILSRYYYFSPLLIILFETKLTYVRLFCVLLARVLNLFHLICYAMPFLGFAFDSFPARKMSLYLKLLRNFPRLLIAMPP